MPHLLPVLHTTNTFAPACTPSTSNPLRRQPATTDTVTFGAKKALDNPLRYSCNDPAAFDVTMTDLLGRRTDKDVYTIMRSGGGNVSISSVNQHHFITLNDTGISARRRVVEQNTTIPGHAMLFTDNNGQFKIVNCSQSNPILVLHPPTGEGQKQTTVELQPATTQTRQSEVLQPGDTIVFIGSPQQSSREWTFTIPVPQAQQSSALQQVTGFFQQWLKK